MSSENLDAIQSMMLQMSHSVIGQEEVVAHDERLGVAQKCSFCVEKIDQAEREDRVPGLDLDVTPACSASCIAQAIQFGDFNDEKSLVSQQVAEQESFQMHAELGTEPGFFYLWDQELPEELQEKMQGE